MEVAPGFSLYHGRLTLTDPGQFERNPLHQWRAFEIIHAYGVDPDPDLEEKISEQAAGINDRFRSAPESVAAFRSFFEKPGHLYRVLEAMHETGFLPRFLQEFERVHCQVQYDRYHIYPVDVHSLYAVRELENLEKSDEREGSVMKEVIGEIRDPALLKLAALFHDLGKAEGSPHTIAGEKIAVFIGKRLALSSSRIADLCFLVREHLSFVEIAHRRDLNDENLIFRFAQSVENSERLKMLYLLCVADLRAVGPAGLDSLEGYSDARAFSQDDSSLGKGGRHGQGTPGANDPDSEGVMELLHGQIPSPKISEYLVSISNRHYGGYQSRAIAQQILMAEKLEEQKVAYGRGGESRKRAAKRSRWLLGMNPDLFAKDIRGLDGELFEYPFGPDQHLGKRRCGRHIPGPEPHR